MEDAYLNEFVGRGEGNTKRGYRRVFPADRLSKNPSLLAQRLDKGLGNKKREDQTEGCVVAGEAVGAKADAVSFST